MIALRLDLKTTAVCTILLASMSTWTATQAQNVPGGPGPAPAAFGSPLPRLSPEQLEAFVAGREEFTSVEDAAGGLGPTFNNNSCVGCHAVPAVGGSSGTTVTRFGRSAAGHFDPLSARGGTLLQRFAIDPQVQEVVPAEANVVAQRQSTPLFGLGLIEAIPDAAIIANAQRPKGDGVFGRPAQVSDLSSGAVRVGHFGWKAQLAVLLDFAADAYVNEMGITSRIFPQENAPNGNAAALAQFDAVPDPEDVVDPLTGKGDIDAAADYMRLLAPPPTSALTADAQIGQGVFAQIGCASCHQPSFVTGPSPIAALNRQTVNLYSDLLLHDMGALGDGIAQGAAGPREMKTAPLWGLRVSAPYLHDGRAGTTDLAVRAHDGEARVARDRYNRLTPQARRQLLEFLDSI